MARRLRVTKEVVDEPVEKPAEKPIRFMKAKITQVPDPLVEIAKLANVDGGTPVLREALLKIAQICKENLRQ